MSKAVDSVTHHRQSNEDEGSWVEMTEGLAHAGSHNVRLRLHDESKVAFGTTDDEAVEDIDKVTM